MAEERQFARRLVSGAALWGKEQTWNALPVPGDGKWEVQAPRWAQYGAQDAGRYRGNPAGCYEARAILEE